MGHLHLSSEEMAQLLTEAMTPNELAASGAHLRACADCRAQLDKRTPTVPAVAAVLSPLQTSLDPLSAAPLGFELLGILGVGKTATVYRARQIGQGRIVALKMLCVGWPNDPEAQRRFQVEIEALASQKHPHIVQVLEVGSHQGRPFLVMEHCANGSLAERLRDGPLPPRHAATLIELLARTLHTVHGNGFVHRDLKPANILFDGEDGPKVADFGVVKRLDSAATQTPAGNLLGTPPYLAPEQIDGSAPTSSRCDVYALGAILYECLVGRPPFRAESIADTLFDVLSREPMPPRLADPRLPRDLETICLKCLEKEPARRYGSALELAEDLDRFLNGQAVRARRVRMLGRTWRWLRRHPLPAALAAALLLTVAGGLALCGLLWHQTEIAHGEAEENFSRTRRLLPELVTASSGRARQGAEGSRIRRAALERSCSFCRELCRVRPDDGELSGELAHVLTALAEAAVSEGRYDSAAVAAEEALALWRRLREEEPQDPRWRRGAAQALEHLAMVRRFLGRARETIDASREAIALYHALADEQPSADGPLLDTVAARVHLSDVLEVELKIEESLSLLEENRRELGSYHAARGYSVEARLALVETLCRLGYLYQMLGDAPAAIRCRHAGCQQGAGLEIALTQDPRAWFFSTVTALSLPCGDSAALTPAQAIPRLEQTMRLLEIGYALDPEHAWWLLAKAGRVLADCYLDVGRPADALRLERRAAEALPPRPDGIPFLELVRLEGKALVARRERQTGQAEAARRRALEVADSFEQFCRTHAADAALLDAAVDFCPRLAPPLRHSAAEHQSRRVVECSLQIVRQRTAANSDATQLRGLSEVWLQMAKCRMRDERDGVEAALREAVDAARRIVGIRTEYRYLLDDRLARLAHWLAVRGRRTDAAACLHECQRLWDGDADGLRALSRRFHDLADEVNNAQELLSNEEQDEREEYLAEAARLGKNAATALTNELTSRRGREAKKKDK